MKILVTYYSRSANTKTVAQKIAKNLGADFEEIIDKKNRTRKIVGWIIAGRDASTKKLTEISYKKDSSKYDLVLIGTPVWAWTMTPAIRTYLFENKAKIVGKKSPKLAFFCTQGGSGDQKTFIEMAQLSKKSICNLTFIDKQISDCDNSVFGFCEAIKKKLKF